MFDEDHLIAQYLKRIKKQTQPTVLQESAFNEALDRRLKRLVKVYRFNFEAIALHLVEEFPQFQYKISKAGIAYRWYQLVKLQTTAKGNADEETGREEERKTTSNAEVYDAKGKASPNVLSKIENHNSQSQSDQEQIEVRQCMTNVRKPSNEAQEKIEQLERALAQAQKLAENESQCFIIYKPNYLTSQPLSLPLPSQQLHPDIGHQTESDQSSKSLAQPSTSLEFSYEYDYNYSQLESEYNHYNQIVSSIGFGFRDDSATDGTASSGSQYGDEDIFGEGQGEEGQQVANGNKEDILDQPQPQPQPEQKEQDQQQQQQQIQFFKLSQFR